MAILVKLVDAVAPMVCDVGSFIAAVSSGTLRSSFNNYSAYWLVDRTTGQNTSQVALEHC